MRLRNLVSSHIRDGSDAALTNGLGNRKTDALGGSRVLASDDLAINNNLLAPWLICLCEIGALGLEDILQEEGHGSSQLSLVLLYVGEAGDIAALDERLAIHVDIGKDNGSVAYGRHGLAGRIKLLDQLD